MSNAGQAVLTVAGTAVGAYFGNPQLGYLIGNTLGQALFPTELDPVQGPRLQDLRVQSSTVGLPIAQLFGEYRVAGNIIWWSGLIETENVEEQGGKGGPTQEVSTFSYSVDVAIGVAKGTIGSVKRIWADSQLIYDRAPQGPNESDEDFKTRLAISDATEKIMTVYTGSETQDPDPLIESHEGVGEVPAFRGLAYIVFEGFQLTEFGNRLPNFNFEIFDGTVAGQLVEYDNKVVFDWGSNPNDPRNCQNTHEYKFEGQSVWQASIADALNSNGYGDYIGVADTPIGWTTSNASLIDPEAFSHHTILDLASLNWRVARLFLNRKPIEYAFGDSGNSPPDNIALGEDGLLNYDDFTLYHWRSENMVGAVFHLIYLETPLSLTSHSGFSQDDNAIFFIDEDVGAFCDVISPGADIFVPLQECIDAGLAAMEEHHGSTCPGFTIEDNLPFATYAVKCNDPDAPPTAAQWGPQFADWYWLRDLILETRIVSRCPDPPCLPRCADPYPDLPENPDYCVVFGRPEHKNGWSQISGTFHVLQEETFHPGAYRWITRPLGPALPVGDPNDTQAFWEAAYSDALAAGKPIASGLSYPDDYPVQVSSACQRVTPQLVAVDPGALTLDLVVTDLCLQVGLTASELDVTDLAAVPIDGLGVTRVTTAATVLEQLRLFGLFDVVESGETLVFRTRGGAIDRTLPAAELAAHPPSQDRPSSAQAIRVQDTELPRRIRLHYADRDNGQLPGQQYAARLVTSAANVQDIELPIAMTADRAAQLAEIHLITAWVSRETYRVQLPQSQLQLEPADVVEVPVRGILRRARVAQSEVSLPGLVRLTLARDDSATYVSQAVGAPADLQVGLRQLRGPTEPILLDLPRLAQGHTGAGYYGVGAGALAGWRGGTVFRASLGGNDVAELFTQDQRPRVLQAVDSLNTFGRNIMSAETLVVSSVAGSAPEGRTVLDVLGGANAYAYEVRSVPEAFDDIPTTIGWEVIQHVDASENPDGTYTLSRFLRGRLGTDWAEGLHQPGDRLVALRRVHQVDLQADAIGIARDHLGVSFGASLDTATTVSFTPQGERARARSVAHIRGSRDAGTGDLTITWVRRSRTPGTWWDEAPEDESPQYDVLILDGQGQTVRTLAVSAESAVYTGTDQTADFGALQSAVTIQVYRVASLTGRGRVAEATV